MPQYITYRTDLPLDCILELKDIAVQNLWQAKEPEAVAGILTVTSFIANTYPGHPVAMVNSVVNFQSLPSDQHYTKSVATESEKEEIHNLLLVLEPAKEQEHKHATKGHKKVAEESPQIVGKLGDGTLLNSLLPILIALLKKYLNIASA